MYICYIVELHEIRPVRADLIYTDGRVEGNNRFTRLTRTRLRFYLYC